MDLKTLNKCTCTAKQNEERFLALIKATSDVIYSVSPDWKTMTALCGRGFLVDTDEPDSNWLDKYIYPEDKKLVLDVIQSSIAEKKTLELEHRVFQADGSIGWTFSRAVPIFDENGDIKEWFGAASDITERKRIEEALCESEEKYRMLFDSIDEGFCIAEVLFDCNEQPVDYRFLEVNQSFEKQTGLVDAAGRRMRDMKPDHEEYWFDIYGRVALTGEPVRFQNGAKQLDRYYDVYAFRVGEPEQRRVAILFNDIMEQKIAEIEKERLGKSISDQLARMQALVDSLPVGVWICDVNGKLEMTNKAVARIYGGNIPLINGAGGYEEYTTLWSDTGEKIPVERFPLVRAISGETVENMIVGYEHIDGTIGTEIISAVPIYDENGDITGGVAVAMDITELRKTEEALRESEVRFRAVLENSMDGISLLNIKTEKYDYINPAQAKITGFMLKDLEDIDLKGTTERVHPEDLPRIIQTFEISKKEGAAEAEFRWKIKSGEYRWFSKRSSPISGENGEPIYIVNICRDITERKRAEQELREAKKHAHNLIKELEEADKNKDQFISVLSHELKNPLAAILAGVQMLDITQDTSLITKSKEVIKRQTDKLCRLVDDLLELTRITQNKINLKRKNINLNETVRNVVEDVMHGYEKKGIKLGAKIQTEPIFLNADPVRIAQIIENILSNALKFTREDGTVRLTLKREGNCAIIDIKDNGIDISPEILPYLFTPFTQAEDALDRCNGGLGLGLSIVKAIVDLHGGTVSAYSDGLGKGSTFTIRLPITVCP